MLQAHLPPAHICPVIHLLGGTVHPKPDRTLKALPKQSLGQHLPASPPRTLSTIVRPLPALTSPLRTGEAQGSEETFTETLWGPTGQEPESPPRVWGEEWTSAPGWLAFRAGQT